MAVQKSLAVGARERKRAEHNFLTKKTGRERAEEMHKKSRGALGREKLGSWGRGLPAEDPLQGNEGHHAGRGCLGWRGEGSRQNRRNRGGRGWAGQSESFNGPTREEK